MRREQDGASGRGYVYLAVLLLAFLVVHPLFPWTAHRVFVLALAGSAWIVSGGRGRHRIALVVLALPAFAAIMVDILFPSHEELLFPGEVRAFVLLMTVVLLLYCAGILVGSLVRTKNVTGHEILGAVCLYMVLGFTWAQAYTLVEFYLPGSFNMASPVATSGEERFGLLSPRFVYFSFITLATQGYGDITPCRVYSQLLVVIETIVGQMYVALVVAYLLSVHITQRLTNARGRDS